MVERVQHCCKTRHCCRDGSCRKVTEDEDLKRIEDKLVEALPGLAGEEKPPEYADVPQEVMEIQELGTSHWSMFLPAPPQGGGWVAPTACGAGVCGSLGGNPANHDKGCEYAKRLSSGGWAMSSEFIAPLPPLELPRVSVRRGGIRWPRFSVETLVVSRKRFLRRTRWELHIRYHENDSRTMHHYMEFTSESAARNAEQIVKFMMSWINDSYHEEKEQRR